MKLMQIISKLGMNLLKKKKKKKKKKIKVNFKIKKLRNDRY